MHAPQRMHAALRAPDWRAAHSPIVEQHDVEILGPSASPARLGPLMKLT